MAHRVTLKQPKKVQCVNVGWVAWQLLPERQLPATAQFLGG